MSSKDIIRYIKEIILSIVCGFASVVVYYQSNYFSDVLMMCLAIMDINFIIVILSFIFKYFFICLMPLVKTFAIENVPFMEQFTFSKILVLLKNAILIPEPLNVFYGLYGLFFCFMLRYITKNGKFKEQIINICFLYSTGNFLFYFIYFYIHPQYLEYYQKMKIALFGTIKTKSIIKTIIFGEGNKIENMWKFIISQNWFIGFFRSFIMRFFYDLLFATIWANVFLYIDIMEIKTQLSYYIYLLFSIFLFLIIIYNQNEILLCFSMFNILLASVPMFIYGQLALRSIEPFMLYILFIIFYSMFFGQTAFIISLTFLGICDSFLNLRKIY